MDARRRTRLAPLEPDAFLRWAWETGDRIPGSLPLTVSDLAWELERHGNGYSEESLRRIYVRQAARVRRNQRLGLEAWEGVG
jgi:hypothetical protein